MKKEEKINDGHYTELLDRIFVIQMNLETFVQEHILIKSLPENHPLKVKLNKAQKALFESYQITGNLEDEQ